MLIIQGKILEGSTVYTDGWKAYDPLVLNGYDHYCVFRSQNEFVRGKNHVNGIEFLWIYCKRRMVKCDQIVSDKFHFLLKECEFRYNYKNYELAKRVVFKNLFSLDLIFISHLGSTLHYSLNYLSLKNRDNSLCSSNLQKIRVGFTLVELIIVITILSILGLVAFLMMSDATVSARDSNRLASIKNIYDASQLQAVQQRSLPLPDQAITLTVSGTDIGWQGYMSGYIAQAYGYSDSVYDPQDRTPYIYRVGQARDKSQYLAYLENGGSISQGDILVAQSPFSPFFPFFPSLDSAQAADFSKRVPYVYGDRLGIVLNNTTNEPANALIYDQNTNTGTLDLGSGSIDTSYSVYVNESLKLSSVEGTGATALKTNDGLDSLLANFSIFINNSTFVVLPDTPLGLSAIATGANHITIGWRSATGATSYSLFRSTSSTGIYSNIHSNIVNTNYTDTTAIDGITYYYKVSAQNISGSSALSTPVSALSFAVSYVYESDRMGVIKGFQYDGGPTALLYVDDNGDIQCYGPSSSCAYPNVAIQAANARGKVTHLLTSRVFSRAFNSNWNNMVFCALLDTNEALCHNSPSASKYYIFTDANGVYNVSPPMDGSLSYLYGSYGKMKDLYGSSSQIREPYKSTGFAVQVFNGIVLSSTGRINAWNLDNSNVQYNTAFHQGLPDIKYLSRGTTSDIFTYQNRFCGITTAGTPLCWRYDNETFYPNPTVISGVKFTKISVGYQKVCAITEAETVYCWDDSGNLINTVPSGLTDVVEVSAGQETMCARTTLGKIACWGGDFATNQASYIPLNLQWTP